jgi:hypothetical protein
VRAVQAIKQPSPPPLTGAEIASSAVDASDHSSSTAASAPDAAAGNGAKTAQGASKWSKALHAVKAVNEMKKQAGVGAGDENQDQEATNGGEPPSGGEPPMTGKGKWKTALSAVKAANGMQRMFAEQKLEQAPEDHSCDFVGAELWEFVVATSDLIYVPQKQRELIFTYAGPFYDRGVRSTHLVQIGRAIEAVFSHMLPFDKYEDKQRAAWDWLWSNISHSLGHELDVLEKDYNTLVLSTWELVKERADVDALGQEFWKRLNEIAPDQTHIFR